jgi:hypothetical protein
MHGSINIKLKNNFCGGGRSMKAANSGSLEKPIIASINCVKYVVRDERNINVLSMQE